MKLVRKAAVAAAVFAGALAFAPAAAQAHSSHSTGSSTTCAQGNQTSAGTNIGLVNLGNLGLSALNYPAIGVLGIAGTQGGPAVVCGNS